jgi:hypothetical protein
VTDDYVFGLGAVLFFAGLLYLTGRLAVWLYGSYGVIAVAAGCVVLGFIIMIAATPDPHPEMKYGHR